MADRPPHDHAYQNMFSHAQMVRDLLRGFVPEAWVDELDFTSLEKISGRHLSDDLRGRESDVIWRVRLRDEWLYVYLLLEFQSRDDRWMALRVLVYTGLLYQDLIRARAIGRGERLPAVFPIVIYNGRKPWRAVRELAELIQPLPAGLQAYRPNQRYFVLDERWADGDEPGYAGSAPPGNLVRALIDIERATDRVRLYELVTDLSRRLAAPQHESLRRAFTAWLNQVVVKRVAPTDNPPQYQDLQEVGTMLEQTVDGWVRKWKREALREGRQEGLDQGLRQGLQQGLEQGIEQGIERGLEQGLAKGEAKGRVEGRIELLEQLLVRRFGEPLPDWVRPRLQAAGIEQLDAWAQGLFEARSLEDLLGPG